MLKILIYSLTLISLLSCSKEKTSEELATEILHLMKSEQSIEEDKNEFIATAKRHLETDLALMKQSFGFEISPNIDDILNKYIQEVGDEYSRHIGIDSIGEEYINIYIELFTREELEDLASFYSSDTGKSFIQKEKLIEEKTQYMVREISLKMQPKLEKLQSRFTKDIEKAYAEELAIDNQGAYNNSLSPDAH